MESFSAAFKSASSWELSSAVENVIVPSAMSPPLAYPLFERGRLRIRLALRELHDVAVLAVELPLLSFVSALPEIYPEVAKKALKQFPDFASTMVETTGRYKEIIDKCLEVSDADTATLLAACSAINESNQRELEKDGLTFEERERLIDKSIQIVQVMREIDANNKRFRAHVIRFATVAFGIVVGALITALGGKANVTLPEVKHAASRMVPIRVLGAVHAGEQDKPWEFDGEAMLYAELADKHPNCYSLRVSGTCMNRNFTDKDVIFVDPDMPPADGSIGVVSIDGQVLVRRVRKGNDSLMLVAETTETGEWEDIIVQGQSREVRPIGTVFWWQSGYGI